MGILVSELITKTRTILNDKLSDNFSQDDISDLVDGSAVTFRAFNMNILNAAGGAPADPIVRVNGIASAISSFVASTGMITLSSAPASGSLTYLEYFFQLMADADYIGFAQQGLEFVGLVPNFTLSTQDSGIAGPLSSAVVHYMAHLAASKMTNLASWYYHATAGNKDVDKTEIAKAFTDMAKEQYATAKEVRDDFYTREGARNAPAWGRGHTPFRSYTPPR